VTTIGLAQPDEVALLPRVEERASERFLTVPQTAHLPACPTPLADFEVAQRAGLLWIARYQGSSPVGFALAEDLGPSLHLEELDVLPEHGRRGIGAALVRRVCHEAAARRRALTLCTFRDVPWNAPWYERLGFRPLPSEEQTPELRRRIQEESERGLMESLRVAMRFEP